MTKWERVWLSVVSVGMVAFLLTGAKRSVDHRGEILRVKGIEIVDENGGVLVSIRKFEGKEIVQKAKDISKRTGREISKETLDLIGNQVSGMIQLFSEGGKPIATIFGTGNTEGGYNGAIHISSTNDRGGVMYLQPKGLLFIGTRDDKGKATSAAFWSDGDTFWNDKEKQKHVFVSEIR